MATKTISLKEEAYERLKAHKREGESFTDVVNRLTGAERDVWKGYGMYRDEEGERLRECIEAGREEMDEEMGERGNGLATELGDGDDE